MAQSTYLTFAFVSSFLTDISVERDVADERHPNVVSHRLKRAKVQQARRTQPTFYVLQQRLKKRFKITVDRVEFN